MKSRGYLNFTQELSRQSQVVIFLLGFFSIANAFYFSLGVNLRVFDIMFYVALVWGIIYTGGHIKYFTNINVSIVQICIIFSWLTLSGVINFYGYSQMYRSFFVKYWIQKVFWLLIYVTLYLLYGQSIVKIFLYGLTAMCVFHVGLVLVEYYTIQNTGGTIDFQFLNTVHINVEEKKYDVFNQGFIRPTGVTMDPNYATGYAGIAFLFCEYIKSQIGKKWYLSFFQVLVLTIMVLLFSRTGLFSICITFLISIFFSLRKVNRRPCKVIAPEIFVFAIISIVVSLIVIGFSNEELYEILIRRLTMKDGSSQMRNNYIVDYFLNADMKELLWGTGTSGSGFCLSKLLGMNVGYVWSPESTFITLFIEQGIVFLILFIVFITITFLKLMKSTPVFAYIFLYINVMGMAYNFLGDRVYFFLLVIFSMYGFDNRRIENRPALSE